MHNFTIKVALAFLALGTAPAAQAGVSEDFAGCDGLKKPKSKDDGMRGEATIGAFNPFGNTGAASFTIAACDRALASPMLRATQTVRRAHLLRARAAARLRGGDAEAALADLVLATAAIASVARDPMLARSMGLSLDLLRAAALSNLGRHGEAATLAEAVAAQRPYALEIQLAAATVQRAVRADGAPLGSAWANLVRIEPAARGRMVSDELDAGHFAAAVRLAAETPSTPSRLALAGGLPPSPERLAGWMMERVRAAQLAYAHAAMGDAAAARAQLALVDETAWTERPDALAELFERLEADVLGPMVGRVNARLALAEGRPEPARALLSAADVPANPFTAELATAYLAAMPQEAATLPAPVDVPVVERQAVDLSALASLLLIKPESTRSRADYKKSRPDVVGALIGGALSFGTSLLGGVNRTAGFRSTTGTDGTVLVEYTGNTTSGTAVQEMTLLRAAELAREAGATHLRVERRSDYQRYLVASQYGREVSRTLSGYKTELTVRFVPGAEASPLDLDAATIMGSLGPVYYEAG